MKNVTSYILDINLKNQHSPYYYIIVMFNVHITNDRDITINYFIYYKEIVILRIVFVLSFLSLIKYISVLYL